VAPLLKANNHRRISGRGAFVDRLHALFDELPPPRGRFGRGGPNRGGLPDLRRRSARLGELNSAHPETYLPDEIPGI
jgi:hypothetical protein